MEIVDKTFVVEMHSLKIGDVFRYDDNYFMRIEDAGGYFAVSLSSGELMSWDYFDRGNTKIHLCRSAKLFL